MSLVTVALTPERLPMSDGRRITRRCLSVYRVYAFFGAMAGGRTSVRKSKYPLKGVLDTTVRVGLATAQAEANKAKEKVMSKLTEAIANAVVESDSFMGSFSYSRNPDGSIGDVLVMVSDGQASGSPEVGSGVLVVEKKSKVQCVTLTELVTTKTVMGVGASLWKFTNDTASLKR